MRTKEFLAQVDHGRIVAAIGAAESKTSGQIRVFVKRGNVGDALTAAQKQFQKLEMEKTRERNAVLIFVAPRTHQFAVIGDAGVHEKCGDVFWEKLIDAMREHFRKDNFTAALEYAIAETGSLLAQHFPRAAGSGSNELPDEIVEG